MKALFFIIILFLFFSIKLFSQKPFFEKKEQTRDSLVIEYKYYLVNPSDTLFRIEVYKNNTLFIKSYTTTTAYYSLEGVTSFYYSSNSLEAEGVFKNDNPDGKLTNFYEDGIIRKVSNYINGVLKGSFVEYYKTGIKKEEGNYDYFEKEQFYPFYSSKVGRWKYYYENGHIKEERNYFSEAIKREKTVLEEYTINGKFDDVRYFKESQLPANILDESEYKRNVKHGEWKYWNEEGKLIKIEIYDKDKLIETKKF